jgi:hypothetical protein
MLKAMVTSPFQGKGKASMFFSEEKNQKTFTSPPLPRSRQWPVSFRGQQE